MSKALYRKIDRSLYPPLRPSLTRRSRADGSSAARPVAGGSICDLRPAHTIVKMPVGRGAPVTLASTAQGTNVYPTSIAVDATSVYWAVGEGEGGPIFTAQIFSVLQ